MNFCLFDAHCDTAYELWRRGESLAKNSCHIALNKVADFSAYAQIFAFCSYAGQPEHLACKQGELLEASLHWLRKEVSANQERIAFAGDLAEIVNLNSMGKIAALLSIEGPELIACDPERLLMLRQQGFVMTTLTWNADNVLAGSHGGEMGLTERGREFVRTAQNLDILIDVSHLSGKAFWDLAEFTCKPILASHSNCRSLCENSRNLTDDQLRAIAQTGGVVGLNLYAPFLGENADFETLRHHLEHMLSLCGEKHVCLGGDLDGCDELPKEFFSVSDYRGFYNYLQSRGYAPQLLEDIFYNNLLHLF
ncbi:MAG: membrane dipeptidase [Oscillospiraceae bacterium]|nr:membrane dipeptidase [Oscillospiraceae bacterium]